MGFSPEKGMVIMQAQLKYTMCMQLASSSSTCIMSSEGPESTDINWEQAQH